MMITKKWTLVVCILLFMFVFVGGVQAIKNVCQKCRTMAASQDVLCKKCRAPLNQCLACGSRNAVESDYCRQCGEMLAEMRVLGTIDPELREELRLGQSERAQLERELAKLDNLLQKEPEKAEVYLYRRAKIFKKMEFFAKEATAWGEYVEKFPQSPRKNRVLAFYSEALRQWGYLFYQQNEMPNALGKFEQAVKANPMNAEAWQWIGRVKNEAKDKEGAAKAYMSSLEARPGDKVAIHFLRQLKKTIPKELLKPVAPVIALPEPSPTVVASVTSPQPVVPQPVPVASETKPAPPGTASETQSSNPPTEPKAPEPTPAVNASESVPSTASASVPVPTTATATPEPLKTNQSVPETPAPASPSAQVEPSMKASDTPALPGKAGEIPKPAKIASETYESEPPAGDETPDIPVPTPVPGGK